jgi:acyl-CoA synthetase (AMP-forming)/AMP-acid ligase II
MKMNGVTKGSCVAIDAVSLIVASAFNFACGMIGCSWVRYTTNSKEASGELGITHIFHESPIKYEGSIPTFPLDQSWVTIPQGVDPSFNSYDHESDPFIVAQSSGTTGNVKFIKIPYGEYILRIDNNFDIQFEDAKSAAFLFPPLKSTTQYKVANLMFRDLPIVTNLRYEDLENYPRLQIVCSHAQAAHFVRGYQPPEVPFDVTIDVAGAATDVKYLEEMFKYFNQINIGYGATETSRTFNKRLRTIEDFNGSSGFPFPDVEVKFEPGDDSVMIKTPRAFGNEWFSPGDYGYMKEGELYVTGRKNDQLNIGGVKIDPVSIENQIKTINGVLDCLVFKDDTIEKIELQLSAFVVSNKEVSIEIHDVCRDKFGISKIPQNVYYVDDLPRNENGKASRHLALKASKEFKKTKYVYVYN